MPGPATGPGSAPGIDLAPMTVRHLPQVMAIETASFTTPWSESAFRAELAQPEISRPVVAITRTEPRRVVGYVLAWKVADEVRILNVAVDSGWRRRGVGEALLRHAIEQGKEQGCRLAELEVRPSNQEALALYHKLGFTLRRRRPAYYSDTREDALVLERSLEESSG